MIFLVKFVISYVAIMFAMCLDNIFWISSSPEYETFKALKWFKKDQIYILKDGKKYYTKLSYTILYRIGSVLKDKRDIIPALVSSIIFTLIL